MGDLVMKDVPTVRNRWWGSGPGASLVRLLLALLACCLLLTSCLLVLEVYGSWAIGVYVTAIWLSGWLFLWFRADRVKKVEELQHQVGMPPGDRLMQLKLASIGWECFGAFFFWSLAPDLAHDLACCLLP